MSGAITEQEGRLISDLKRSGVLIRFIPEAKTAENGGVAVVCSDGDIDASIFHRRISKRPHEVKIFGGPLFFSPKFGGYQPDFERAIMANIKQGMEVKGTSTIFLYFHAPCGMAMAYKHNIQEVLEMAGEVSQRFLDSGLFGQVFPLFHVKRINKAEKVEENTYLINI